MRGGHYVLMARRRAGLSQRELAGRLGLRQATIARWERGDRQVSVEDVEAVAAACGLQLEVRLAVEDHSWWSQIARQLELDPLDRLKRLTPASSPNLAAGLGELAAAGHPVVVIGEMAGALQGWPLVLGGAVIEVCSENGLLLTDIGRRLGRHEYGLPSGARLRAVDVPPGTHGFRDLWRGAEPIDVEGGELQVASVLDLLRIHHVRVAQTRTKGLEHVFSHPRSLRVAARRHCWLTNPPLNRDHIAAPERRRLSEAHSLRVARTTNAHGRAADKLAFPSILTSFAEVISAVRSPSGPTHALLLSSDGGAMPRTRSRSCL